MNTFQVALVFNRQASFVFFFYDQINLNGRVANIGFGPAAFLTPLAVPFNLPGVLFGDTLSSVAAGSNTGSPGFYAYQVNMRSIMEPNG